MSVERGESEVGSKGRAVHRKDSSATGASSVHSGSAASVPLVEPLAHMVRIVIVCGLCIAGQDFTVMHFEIKIPFLVFAGARYPTSRRRQRQWLERKNREWEREWRGKCWARQHQGEEGQS